MAMDALRRARGLARSMWLYRANPLQRRRSRAFYAQFLRPGDLGFDIGAHLGDRVDVWLALGVRVVAVEPQPHLVRRLVRRYRDNPRVTVIPAAIGAAPGHAELLINQRNPALSTLSADWAAAVGASPRFQGESWDARATVAVTTLDDLIAAHGEPAFCKIDVEGFEAAVLAGLSRPLPCLSFEFIPATPDRTQACLDRLDQLGDYRFNVSLGETKRMLFPDWVGRGELARWFGRLRPGDDSGDIYAYSHVRLANQAGRMR